MSNSEQEERLPKSGILTRDVVLLSTGFHRRKGQRVNQGEVPEAVWKAWVDEGVIGPPPPTDKIDKQVERRVARSTRPKKVLK